MAELNNVSSTESKGGLKYDLILEKPANDTPPKVRPLQSPIRKISVEEISNKLKSAEERRKSIEAQKITQAKEHVTHVIETRHKLTEIESTKLEASRQSLEKKMEAFKENREKNIKAIQEKQKEHEKKVAEAAKRKVMNASGGDETSLVN